MLVKVKAEGRRESRKATAEGIRWKRSAWQHQLQFMSACWPTQVRDAGHGLLPPHLSELSAARSVAALRVVLDRPSVAQVWSSNNHEHTSAKHHRLPGNSAPGGRYRDGVATTSRTSARLYALELDAGFDHMVHPINKGDEEPGPVPGLMCLTVSRSIWPIMLISTVPFSRRCSRPFSVRSSHLRLSVCGLSSRHSVR